MAVGSVAYVQLPPTLNDDPRIDARDEALLKGSSRLTARLNAAVADTPTRGGRAITDEEVREIAQAIPSGVSGEGAARFLEALGRAYPSRVTLQAPAIGQLRVQADNARKRSQNGQIRENYVSQGYMARTLQCGSSLVTSVMNPMGGASATPPDYSQQLCQAESRGGTREGLVITGLTAGGLLLSSRFRALARARLAAAPFRTVVAGVALGGLEYGVTSNLGLLSPEIPLFFGSEPEK